MSIEKCFYKILLLLKRLVLVYTGIQTTKKNMKTLDFYPTINTRHYFLFSSALCSISLFVDVKSILEA